MVTLACLVVQPKVTSPEYPPAPPVAPFGFELFEAIGLAAPWWLISKMMFGLITVLSQMYYG